MAFKMPHEFSTASLDITIKHYTVTTKIRAKELCESGGGRPGLPVPNKPAVSVDVEQHL